MTQLDAIYFKNFREDHGISQARLSRAMGVHRCTIIRIESGKFRPQLETLRRFEILVKKHEGEK